MSKMALVIILGLIVLGILALIGWDISEVWKWVSL